jgi:ABC-type multidrug transport system ATPase subunit
LYLILTLLPLISSAGILLHSSTSVDEIALSTENSSDVGTFRIRTYKNHIDNGVIEAIDCKDSRLDKKRSEQYKLGLVRSKDRSNDKEKASVTNRGFQVTYNSLLQPQENLVATADTFTNRDLCPVSPISSFRFSFVLDPINVDFCSLNLNLKISGLPVLQNICGGFKAGHITAIIGPSGAGKTSLLSLLRGNTHYATISGVIKVNKTKVANLQGIRDRVAYVSQEDIIYDALTVEENIMFSALLFNRKGLTKRKNLYPIVNHTLELLGLKFICCSVVGNVSTKGISGGQRRRVSVAMELMKEADMILLDEPTSGLDSATSISLMNCLHSLAVLGTNVVATLHQPRSEIFHLVDSVILLAPGGRVAYYGILNVISIFCTTITFNDVTLIFLFHISISRGPRRIVHSFL